MATASNPRQRHIGELAAELGLNPKTLRYYEQIGLLPAPPRTPAGYRLYGERDLQRLRFIGQAKALGLTLREIAEILTVHSAGERPCELVLATLDRKLDLVDQRLRALREFRQDLVALRGEAAETMYSDAGVCAIIERHEATQPSETIAAATTDLVRRSSRTR